MSRITKSIKIPDSINAELEAMCEVEGIKVFDFTQVTLAMIIIGLAEKQKYANFTDKFLKSKYGDIENVPKYPTALE